MSGTRPPRLARRDPPLEYGPLYPKVCDRQQVEVDRRGGEDTNLDERRRRVCSSEVDGLGEDELQADQQVQERTLGLIGHARYLARAAMMRRMSSRSIASR